MRIPVAVAENGRSGAVGCLGENVDNLSRPGGDVLAPSLIPMMAGDRDANRHDAAMLARLRRAGELTPVFAPGAGHEAMRDLIRRRGAVRKTAPRAP